MTRIDREAKSKVHYPLPLMPLETDKPHTLDPATLKLMIAKMARSMTDFHKSTEQSQASSHHSGFNQSLGGRDQNFVTAKSFFSRQNVDHPSVQENMKLKKRLSVLSSIRQSGGI